MSHRRNAGGSLRAPEIAGETSRGAGVDPALRMYRDSAGGARAHACMTAESGRDAVEVAGFHGASLAFFLAAICDPGGGPVLVVTSTQEEAEELREELEEFSGRPALFLPPWESLFLDDSRPDEEIFHERLGVLKRLEGAPPGELFFVVAPVHAVIQPVASGEALADASWTLEAGADLPRDDIAERLDGLEFRRVPLVLRRGEYSVRGDILDLFSLDAARPIRVEFFGDTVESMREFDPETQRSLSGDTLTACRIVAPSRATMFKACFDEDDSLILDSLPVPGRLVLAEPASIEERAERILHNLLEPPDRDRALEDFLGRLARRPCLRAHGLALPAGREGLQAGFESVERFSSERLESAMEALGREAAGGGRVEIYCESEAESQRMRELLRDHDVAADDGVRLRVGPVRRGFAVPAIGTVILTAREIFRRQAIRRARRRPVETQVVRSFFELEDNDLVVHVSHGIGRYLGARLMERNGTVQEFLELEFRRGVKVYVPASKIDLVQKYVGSGAYRPPLDKVGGASWSRRKQGVEQAVQDFATELLEVQAMRRERPGTAYPPDTEWQRQLEASFPYEDTADQIEATSMLKSDLESHRPMDRLLCGDVGYGKTEVAIRAAFKVVSAGKQVAVLVPTTVLAQQHCRTFRERLGGFPVQVEQISRFCTPRQQREILRATRAGQVDILIGTHRMLSDDVSFADLGLVVIDEEQRFGVAHKEKLKKMRALVDVLTMTATPIPRTLHMALLGIRDISSLSTPPEGRSPIQTDVIEFDRRVMREAILRELNREGQVYFVHNRVNDIAVIRDQLQQVVPEARMEFAHGQMSEHQLESIMMRFLDCRIDVLISTTIIETGIDIPNVNTIFINECDRYGLADLHQLRGRVGRSRHRAYCYLVLPEHRHVNPDARKRIQSIREFSQLGAGFQIAMRDLEIRGAGNILGSAQSGHIAVVGYDLYCRLLERAVKEKRGEKGDRPVDVEIDLDIEAYIPDHLVPDDASRLDIYRRLSKMENVGQVEDMAHEIRDRCGELPLAVERLLETQILRILAARRGLLRIAFDAHGLVLGCTESMRPLLDECPHRVVVLGPAEVSVVINDPLDRSPRVALDDVRVFRLVLEWLRDEKFPSVADSPVSAATSKRG